GNDRPDIRFGVELQDVSATFVGTQFNAFAQTLAGGGEIKAIVVPGCAEYTRREIDELTELAKRSGARGLATFAVRADEIRSPIAKFLSPEEMAAITSGIGAAPGDLVLAVADAPSVVAKTLSGLRDEIGRRLNLADPEVFAFCWVYEFPLLEFNEEEQRWEATHNPFSGFLAEDAHLIATDPSKVRAKQYDLVGNGFELGGGSVRNHRRADQEAMFALMGYPAADLQARFGALLEALDYGAPPHGGIAMGVDRFAMLLAEADNIREVIAFPKNQRGLDVMFGSPGQVVTEQLDDLGLVLDPKKAVTLW
ncbi:MAG: amino acid--tRNA ligase-related protein, partial [Chloroflexota bacterium]